MSQARKVEAYEPSPSDFAEYEGDHHSEELLSTWTAAVEEGRLVLRHYRRGSVTLEPMAPDRFHGPSFADQGVTFGRDDSGRVVAVTFSSEGVCGDRFPRVPARPARPSNELAVSKSPG